MRTDFLVQAGGKLSGTLRVPGDKSISHRSIILGAVAEGDTEVAGFLEGEDALATMNIFRALGVRIEGPEHGRVLVHGVGLRGLKAPPGVLDCGNSGTSMRLICGLLAGQNFDAELSGDQSLRRRPMRRVAEPLGLMGAQIRTDDGRPPLKISGKARLRAIDYTMPVASAQVKSALLLAGLYAEGETRITEIAPTRDHTERMLEALGRPVRRQGATVALTGGPLRGTRIEVPADISSAAFFMVGAAIAPGSDIMLTDVGVNPTRTGVIDILRLMGADIELMNPRRFGGEPVADIRVRYAPLAGVRIPRALVPLAIDEFPALFIAAANARAETLLAGAEELRVKESDRIQAMADGLGALGIGATPLADGMRIRGCADAAERASAYRGGTIDSHGDHRVAMAFAIAALRSAAPIEIRDCANVATSFPGFADLARGCGLAIALARTA
ncbi:MAG: 3-phosphoshikimate 1-carboxyvinyltransferase [Betaproteobacteria bacterium]|nr:3-phosphoshikimate 1-carboxyvinyltransferase [Betaproteobacteria bacterium]MBI2961793.1 3-phosphoshikimate 1-carboxyvinyltransferase [Betaproteobacteria bacterium]